MAPERFVEITFPYRPQPGVRPEKAEIAGPTYPLVHLQLSRKGEKPAHFEGLIDSGADTFCIPREIADSLGLERFDRFDSSGVFQKGICYRTKVEMVIGRAHPGIVRFGEIDAVVPDAEGDIPILIGRNPLFRFFEVVFKEYRDRPALTLIQKRPLHDPS
jgi:predicted aspartyl protease